MNKTMGLRGLVVLLALVALYLVYQQGLSGPLFYDDFANLEGLANISGWESAWQFIVNGMAGPLGRPVALASFALQSGAWPENSAALLQFNIIIHVINAVLIGLLGYACVRVADARMAPAKVFWAAFLAAALWAGLPLLASTSLITVQRMTGLAALFSLVGLIGYVWAYRLYAHNPVKALVVQMALLGIGTLLSMLAKENGALTPLYALVIDFILRGSALRGGRHWAERTRFAILLLGLVVILVFLSPIARDYLSVSETRGYSVLQRLQVQVVVLWDYLRAVFAPIPSLFGPFHDDYLPTVDGHTVGLAILAWLAVLGVAVWLFAAGYSRWVLFAVLWFLVGHLLESTSILLELYFEHRNYLPVYGICLALAVAAMNAPSRYRFGALLLFCAFGILQWLVLLSVTTTWGEPRKAAELWAYERPASSRAVTHAVFVELSKDNDKELASLNLQYINRQRYEHVLNLLDRTSEHCDGCLSARLQAVSYACKLQAYDEAGERLRESLASAPVAKTPRAVVDGLFNIRELIQKESCGDLASEDLLRLINALSRNQLFQIDHISARLYFLAATVSEDMGNMAGRDQYLQQAEAASPVALPVLQYQVNTAIDSGEYQVALNAIERRRPAVVGNQGVMNAQVLDSMRAQVEGAMPKSQAEGPEFEK